MVRELRPAVNWASEGGTREQTAVHLKVLPETL